MLATLSPKIRGKQQADEAHLQIMKQIANGSQWNRAKNFISFLLSCVDFPALLVMSVMNIPFNVSCQFICLPMLHNILEHSYRNWEIWVYKTESICYGFSLYYVLYFISFIFFFINSLSNIWTVIYFICSLQYWI